MEDIDKIHSEMVHWRHNLFMIPSGKQSKAFIYEMAQLFGGYTKATSIEGVGIKTAMVFPAWVYQKPYIETSTSKDHNKCIQRRMVVWEAGS